MNPLLDAALRYAQRGWPVFPCHAPTGKVEVPCTCCRRDCTSPAKHPRILGGLRSATTDAAQVRRWWRDWPTANVAIRTGADSRLVVLDIDDRHGGRDTLARLAREHGSLPAGRTIRTGSNGLHLYFRHPGGVVRNDAGRRLGPGIDIRGDGGYVIAPPSRHVTGGRYVVASSADWMPELPPWALRLVQPPEVPRERTPTLGRIAQAGAWASAAVEGEVQRLRTAPEGARNDTLNRVAFRLGQLVGGTLSEEQIEQILVDNAKSIGLTEHEALATTRSGLRAGERSPRGPAPRSGQGREVELPSPPMG